MNRLLLLLVASSVTAGCYVYQPVEAPPPPGTRVRLHLTSSGALAADEATGQTSRRLDGRLVSLRDDTVRISILTGRETSQFNRARDFRTDLLFSPDQVESISIRRFSTLRTSAVGLAAAVVVGLIIDRAASGGGGDGENGGGGPPLPSIAGPIPPPD